MRDILIHKNLVSPCIVRSYSSVYEYYRRANVERIEPSLLRKWKNDGHFVFHCIIFIFPGVLVIAPSVELSIRQIEDDNTEVVISLQAVLCNFCRVSCDSTCNTSNGLVGCSAAFVPYSIIAPLAWQFF